MEQIKQILKQLSLNLDLSIAMCDMLDDHGKRIAALESSAMAQKSRVDGLYTLMSEANYVAASKGYEARRAALRANDGSTTNNPQNK